MRADRVQRLDADDGEARDHRHAAENAAQRQRLAENEAREDKTAERCAGRLNDRAVAERHIDVAVIAPQRERQAAEQRDRDGAPQADAAEIAEAAHGGDRE